MTRLRMHAKQSLVRPKILSPWLRSLASRGRLRFTGLANENTGVKVAQKKGKRMVSLKLAKKDEKSWHTLHRSNTELGFARTSELEVHTKGCGCESILSV